MGIKIQDMKTLDRKPLNLEKETGKKNCALGWYRWKTSQFKQGWKEENQKFGQDNQGKNLSSWGRTREENQKRGWIPHACYRN